MYNRIHESLFEGSMVGAGAITFAVWAYVLAKMKPDRRDGKFYVEVNPKVLGPLLGEPIQEVDDAMVFLEAPDPESRSKEEGGRRIIREGQFLYRVVNGEEYQKMDSHEKRREYQRQKQAEYRAKRKRGPLPGENAALAAEANGSQELADSIAQAALPEPDEDPQFQRWWKEEQLRSKAMGETDEENPI